MRSTTLMTPPALALCLQGAGMAMAQTASPQPEASAAQGANQQAGQCGANH